MGNPDFRIGGRIFATLSGQSRGRGVLKLTPMQQADFIADLPEIFEPVQGGWGRMGMTYILLDRADEHTMSGALTVAYRNIIGKKATKIRNTSSNQKSALGQSSRTAQG